MQCHFSLKQCPLPLDITLYRPSQDGWSLGDFPVALVWQYSQTCSPSWNPTELTKQLHQTFSWSLATFKCCWTQWRMSCSQFTRFNTKPITDYLLQTGHTADVTTLLSIMLPGIIPAVSPGDAL
jgi:hypothetical protein